jgi:hypothetical protein
MPLPGQGGASVGSCGFLKDFAHIFITTQSQQRSQADSSIEPQNIRVKFRYETRSHNVSLTPLVFPVGVSQLEDLDQRQFAVLPPYTPECLADSFIADTTGRLQNAVSWAVPQDLTSDLHDSNASHEKYAASPKTRSQFSLSLLVCQTHQHYRQPIHRHLRPLPSRNTLLGEFQPSAVPIIALTTHTRKLFCHSERTLLGGC